jgi:hypothetical protein
MALLHEAVESKKLDVRMVERNITRGVVHRDDVTKLIDKLPDDAENAEWVNVEKLEAEAGEKESNGKDRSHTH